MAVVITLRDWTNYNSKRFSEGKKLCLRCRRRVSVTSDWTWTCRHRVYSEATRCLSHTDGVSGWIFEWL